MDILKGYVEAALWCGFSEEDREKYEADGAEWDEESYARMKQDCEAFVKMAGTVLHSVFEHDQKYGFGAYNEEQAGHDFWLTRNHHGAGFWDRNLGECGEWLTNMAVSFPEVGLYLSDDGKICLE